MRAARFGSLVLLQAYHWWEGRLRQRALGQYLVHGSGVGRADICPRESDLRSGHSEFSSEAWGQNSFIPAEPLVIADYPVEEQHRPRNFWQSGAHGREKGSDVDANNCDSGEEFSSVACNSDVEGKGKGEDKESEVAKDGERVEPPVVQLGDDQSDVCGALCPSPTNSTIIRESVDNEGASTAALILLVKFVAAATRRPRSQLLLVRCCMQRVHVVRVEWFTVQLRVPEEVMLYVRRIATICADVVGWS